MNFLVKIMMITIAAFCLLSAPALAASDTANDIFSACTTAPSSPVCKDKNNQVNPIYHTIQVTTNIVALLTGLTAVAIMIISGITLITSSGNSEAVSSARRRMTAAIIGIVIVSLSWVLISYIIDKLVKT